LALALSSAGGSYAVLVYRLGHRNLPLGPAAVLFDLLWAPGIVLLGVIVLLFPDGRLTRRWRRVLWAYLAIAGCWPVAIYAVAISTIVGHRNASGEERAQLKWLIWGVIVFMLAGTVIVLAGTLDLHPSVVVQVAETLALVALNAFPLSVGLAIRKYRLYETDRVISRTLAYTIVTGLLVGCYVGVVALGTDVLPFKGSVAVAISTLAVAALFNPVRRRVQRIVDRRFNRARYDAEMTTRAFAGSLQDAVTRPPCRPTCSARSSAHWSPRTPRSGSAGVRAERGVRAQPGVSARLSYRRPQQAELAGRRGTSAGS
jgi:hypothetical protein